MGAVRTLGKYLPPSLRRRLGELRRRWRSRPSRTRAQKELLLSDPDLENRDRGLLTAASSRVFYNDGMYTGDGAQYFKVGLSAVRCIDAAIQQGCMDRVDSILDLPCGGGRVLRFLAVHYPARIWAGDLQRDMVDFCAEEFDAAPVYSSTDFDQLSIVQSFDIIWCGSLVTHLNAPGIGSLFNFFSRQLQPRGVVVFTTHGARALERMLEPRFDYGVTRESLARMIENFRAGGFGFASYPREDDYGVADNEGQYGISLASREWIRGVAERSGLKEIYFAAQGWDNHQDVYGFVKP